MGLVRVYGEADSRGPYRWFAAGNRVTLKEATVWYLEAGRLRESVEGNRDAGHTDIY